MPSLAHRSRTQLCCSPESLAKYQTTRDETGIKLVTMHWQLTHIHRPPGHSVFEGTILSSRAARELQRRTTVGVCIPR